MNIIDVSNIDHLVADYPEVWEVLHPFTIEGNLQKTFDQSIRFSEIECRALRKSLERVVRRATEYPCNYEVMRNSLCSPGCVNVAGFAGFLVERPLRRELIAFAEGNNIRLNCTFFSKPHKKVFQNYLARCCNADDLPDILIGKGFSSLVSRRFIDLFLKTGYYGAELEIEYRTLFRDAGLLDSDRQFNPFAIEECVVVHDATRAMNPPVPQRWTDLVRPEYHGSITQMGNSNETHFGSAMLLYLLSQGGISMVSRYAANVAERRHFAHIVKSFGDPLCTASPLAVMHNYAARMIRADVRQHVRVLAMKDGNPVTPLFVLIKNKATEEARAVASHLFSFEVAVLLHNLGFHPARDFIIGQHPDPHIRWINWKTFRDSKLPYLKELLSEYAHDAFVPSVA